MTVGIVADYKSKDYQLNENNTMSKKDSNPQDNGNNVNRVLANVIYEFYVDDVIMPLSIIGNIAKGDYIDIEDKKNDEYKYYQVDYITHIFNKRGEYIKTRVCLEAF